MFLTDVQELVSLLADEPAPMMTEIANDGPIADRRETGAPSLGRNWSFNSVRPSRVRGMLASRACRSSIMIGDALSQKQMEQVKSMSKILFLCPSTLLVIIL
jgi:DNA mismatch repair protein PMS2